MLPELAILLFQFDCSVTLVHVDQVKANGVMLRHFYRSMSQKATFAAGCFWSVELVYQREPGVLDTKVGYTGGQIANPTYEQVCRGQTGHAEAVQVTFNPKETSYNRLLDILWEKHDPTQINRQGNDIGSQYRSAIFYHDDQQLKVAKESMAKVQEKLGKKLATELSPLTTFYVAEEYHQKYLEKGGQCSLKGNKDKIRCYG